MFQADSFFRIGSTHKICEDYASHGDPGLPFAIISDGCSGSPDTDIGARLLTLSCKKLISSDDFNEIQPLDYFDFGNKVISDALITAKQLEINQLSLDATLIVAYLSKEKSEFKINIYGDGTVTWADKDNVINHLVIEYPSGYPRYLNYLSSEIRNKQFIDISKNSGIKTHLYKNNELISCVTSDISEPTSLTLSIDNLAWLLLSSDGIETFSNTENGSLMNKSDLVTAISSFKNFNGEFIKRRFFKMIKTFEKNGFTHGDDLSVAGIAITEEISE